MPAGVMTFVDAKLSISTNTTTFTEISSFVTEIKLTGGVRAIAKEFILGSDTAIVAPGKRDTIDIDATTLYTEISTDPFSQYSQPAYENHTPIYLRWEPLGNEDVSTTTTINRFTTDAVYITDPPYPVGTAKADQFIKFQLKGTTSFVSTSTTTIT